MIDIFGVEPSRFRLRRQRVAPIWSGWLWVLAATASFGAIVPPEFEDTEIVRISPPRGFSQLDFAPDGTLFIADKSGRVWRFVDNVLIPLANLPVSELGERGLNGLAVDPDYATNAHLWIYYTTQDPYRNRLSRFTVEPLALVDETVILEGPLVSDTDHNAGDLRFAADKTLFVSIGDDKLAGAAEDPFDLRGKILHIDRDGSPATGNPFVDGVDGDPRVWALGFRNPYRFAIQPLTGSVFIADVGNAAWEELDIGIPGASFGWSTIEGPEPAGVPGFVYPVHAYSHNAGGAAIIGGDFVGPGDFAPRFEGNYFFHDFILKELYRVVLDEDANVAEVETFATDFGRATDLQFGPDGGLYYACYNCGPSAIRRLSYVGAANERPIAVATATPDSGPAPLEVVLDGTPSVDGEDDPLIFSWSLGDGTSSDQATVNHTYAAGVYFASLTVDDGVAGADVANPVRIVSGNSRPAAEILAPANASDYVGGQAIAFLGEGVDPEEGELACGRFTWQIVSLDAGFPRTVFGPMQGMCGGEYRIPTNGNADPDQSFRILLTVEDGGVPLGEPGRLEGSDVIELWPATALLSLATTPLPDLQLMLDDVNIAAPADVESVVDVARTVEAIDLQTGADGRTYVWTSWSDGGARGHSVSAPAEGVALTAHFGCLPAETSNLTVSRNGDGVELFWAAPANDCLAGGQTRYRVYASADPAPADAPGQFPADPAFVLIGTAPGETFGYVPGPGNAFYLVTATGPEGVEGPSGHYPP